MMKMIKIYMKQMSESGRPERIRTNRYRDDFKRVYLIPIKQYDNAYYHNKYNLESYFFTLYLKRFHFNWKQAL